MSLREEVERVLPSWHRWYPSLFDAATDLGLLRAQVCSPDSLLLSKRHEKVQRAAEEAHRERWGGGPEEPEVTAAGRGGHAAGRSGRAAGRSGGHGSGGNAGHGSGRGGPRRAGGRGRR